MQTKSVIRQKNAAVAQAKRHLSVDVVPCYVCVRKRRSAKPANPKPLNPLPENVLLGSTSENLSVDLDEFDAASCLQTRTAIMQIKSVIRQKNTAVAQAKRHFRRLCAFCYVCVRKRL